MSCGIKASSTLSKSLQKKKNIKLNAIAISYYSASFSFITLLSFSFCEVARTLIVTLEEQLNWGMKTFV